jgi:hypothetical protein
LYLADPGHFKENLQEALDAATPFPTFEEEQARIEMDQAFEQCREIAEHPNILILFTEQLPKCGLVGDVKAAKLIFLSLVTRLFERPCSILTDGPSSGGKSFLVETVLKFYPQRAYYDLTAMSERNLAYTDEPLSHRFLVLYEAAGLGGDFATYLVRTLLSEGKIKYEFVEKTNQGFRSRRIEKEGPTGLLITTTQVWRHPENETRLLAVTVDDTKAQTQKIFSALADDDRGDIDFAPWHALQTWLEHGEHMVTIPYAFELAKLTNPLSVRLRRDFGTVLNLIKAHALLHRASRKKDADSRIMATLKDYEAVIGLTGDIISQGVDAVVPESIKETVKVVSDLIEASTEDPPFATIAKVAKELDIDRSATTRRVNTAIQRGYLKNLENKKGRPKKIVTGDPLPADINIFPSATELEEVCTCANGVQVDRTGQQADITENNDGVCRCAGETQGIKRTKDVRSDNVEDWIGYSFDTEQTEFAF